MGLAARKIDLREPHRCTLDTDGARHLGLQKRCGGLPGAQPRYAEDPPRGQLGAPSRQPARDGTICHRDTKLSAAPQCRPAFAEIAADRLGHPRISGRNSDSQTSRLESACRVLLSVTFARGSPKSMATRSHARPLKLVSSPCLPGNPACPQCPWHELSRCRPPRRRGPITTKVSIVAAQPVA